MGNNGQLAKSNLGSVYRCIHGVVHIHCRGVSLHFPEDAYVLPFNKDMFFPKFKRR